MGQGGATCLKFGLLNVIQFIQVAIRLGESAENLFGMLLLESPGLSFIQFEKKIGMTRVLFAR